MLIAPQQLFRVLTRTGLILTMSISLLLTACSAVGGASSDTRLSGNYVDDTVQVTKLLQTTIAIPQEAEGRTEAEMEARSLINDYMSRYRPRREVNGLASFTTMQTALNSLAGHYATYTNRPLPDALQQRISKELAKAERSAVRGS